jgi:hypothetical protein
MNVPAKYEASPEDLEAFMAFTRAKRWRRDMERRVKRCHDRGYAQLRLTNEDMDKLIEGTNQPRYNDIVREWLGRIDDNIAKGYYRIRVPVEDVAFLLE